MPDSLNRRRPSPSWARGRSASPPPPTCWSAAWNRSCWKPGPQPGTPCASGAMCRMFSPWEYNIDKAAERLLAAVGWNCTGARPVSDRRRAGDAVSRAAGDAHPLKDRIRTSSRVTSVGRRASTRPRPRPRSRRPSRSAIRTAGDPSRSSADAVIDATGTWFTPNPAGADGLPAIGEPELQGRIVYGMPDVLGKDRARYAGKTVAVLGAGHSAIGTLIDLARLKDEAPTHPDRSGCCAATIRRRRSAAASTTNWPRAVRWVLPSPAWSPAAR